MNIVLALIIISAISIISQKKHPRFAIAMGVTAGLILVWIILSPLFRGVMQIYPGDFWREFWKALLKALGMLIALPFRLIGAIFKAL